MNPITATDRHVANISASAFTPVFDDDGVALGDEALQANPDHPVGSGFHVYRMAPGRSTRGHRHTGEESFFVLEGELIDNDGTVFRKGDMVSYRVGSEHQAHTITGCLMVVYITAQEIFL